MPWCPKCKNEYVEGVKVCADCGVELAASLNEGKRTPVIFGEQEQMERLQKFLLYNEILSAETVYDAGENVYELYVNEQDRQKAKTATAVFLREEEAAAAKEALPQDKSDIAGYPMRESGYNAYRDSARQAQENRSSGWMLLIIGGLGLIADTLVFTGVIGLSFSGTSRYMLCGVMGTLFVLFLVMGVVSMKSSKKFAKKAASEDSLRTEILKWCEENLTAQAIEECLDEPEEKELEEIRYFKRTEKMKQRISSQFLHLDESFLDAFADDFYAKLFEPEQRTEKKQDTKAKEKQTAKEKQGTNEKQAAKEKQDTKEQPSAQKGQDR